MPRIIHTTLDLIAEFMVQSGNELPTPTAVGSVDLMFPHKHLAKRGIHQLY
jgi:hypothetical protein